MMQQTKLKAKHFANWFTFEESLLLRFQNWHFYNFFSTFKTAPLEFQVAMPTSAEKNWKYVALKQMEYLKYCSLSSLIVFWVTQWDSAGARRRPSEKGDCLHPPRCHQGTGHPRFKVSFYICLDTTRPARASTPPSYQVSNFMDASGTKHLGNKTYQWQNISAKNVFAEKPVSGQNILADKMYSQTKCMSRQNISADKRSLQTKRIWEHFAPSQSTSVQTKHIGRHKVLSVSWQK